MYSRKHHHRHHHPRHPYHHHIKKKKNNNNNNNNNHNNDTSCSIKLSSESLKGLKVTVLQTFFTCHHPSSFGGNRNQFSCVCKYSQFQCQQQMHFDWHYTSQESDQRAPNKSRNRSNTRKVYKRLKETEFFVNLQARATGWSQSPM